MKRVGFYPSAVGFEVIVLFPPVFYLDVIFSYSEFAGVFYRRKEIFTGKTFPYHFSIGIETTHTVIALKNEVVFEGVDTDAFRSINDFGPKWRQVGYSQAVHRVSAANNELAVAGCLLLPM
jgi:hypothetical protein